jgi:NAD(P)-dependent dehydrogenase (short-subunit alcohol dehydrogenase family)
MPVAFVTGCSTGLGRAIAERLARDGFDLVITARDAERLEWAKDNKDLASRAVLRQALALPDRASIDDAVAAAFDRFGSLDALVNNAGQTIRESALDATEDSWDNILDINLKGAFFLTQAIVRRIVPEKRPFRVVNLSSTYGIVGFPNRLLYGVSKAGLIHLTRQLALELGPFGVTANAVGPGPVDTELARRAQTADMRADYLRTIPAGRYGTPEEIAGAVAFLCGPEAAYVNGQTLFVDGGFTAAGMGVAIAQAAART